MTSWGEFRRAAPGLAEEVRLRFAVRKHATLATLRVDGSPRISGTEVQFTGEEVTIGSMPGAVKARDLQRDPRFALHSPTVDPPPDDPSSWAGEAKLAGHAVERAPTPGAPHVFSLDIREAVLTRVDGEELVVWSWHDGRGEQTRRRT